MKGLTDALRRHVSLIPAWLMPVTALLCLSGMASAQSDVHAADHAHHKNEIAGFVGLTHEGRDDGFSLGIEYERRLNATLGLGVLAEHTWGDFDFWVVAVPLAVHVDRWKFAIAPGVEISDEHEHELARLAVGYEFELGEAKAIPSLSVDFVDGEEVYVLGVSFGFGF